MFLCHLRADTGTSGLDDLKRHLCGEQLWGRKSDPLEIHEWLSLLPGQARITGSLRGMIIDSYCPLKCIWSYWSGRGIPQSNKWFSQGQVHQQDSGCVEPCNCHKCGKLKCIIWSIMYGTAFMLSLRRKNKWKEEVCVPSALDASICCNKPHSVFCCTLGVMILKKITCYLRSLLFTII